MNLKIQDIKKGDKFKQIKALGTYMFENSTYEVEKIEGYGDESAILLSFENEKTAPYELFQAKVYLSLDELNKHFERVKKFVWTDWKALDKDAMYKTNKRITFVKIDWNGKTFKGKATCHKDDWDDFDIATGIKLAYERAVKKRENYVKSLSLKMSNTLNVGDKVMAINDDYRNCYFISPGSIGTVSKITSNEGILVEWDSNGTWWIEPYNLKKLVCEFNEGDRVRAINDDHRDLHYVHSNATGKIVKVCKNDLFVEWDYGCSCEDGTGSRRWYIDKRDVEILTEEDEKFEVNENLSLLEVEEDVLEQPCYYTILHTLYGRSNGNAVGLSKEIIDRFNIKETLVKELDFLINISEFFKDNKDMMGDIIYYDYKNVITMITKENRRDKVTYEAIERGLNKVKSFMEENNLNYLAMPRICCGYENLNWEKVKAIIIKTFKDSEIPITIKVCHKEK